jgi:hypothetical protein
MYAVPTSSSPEERQTGVLPLQILQITATHFFPQIALLQIKIHQCCCNSGNSEDSGLWQSVAPVAAFVAVVPQF